MTTYNIAIACDQHEAEEFSAWLREHGHCARVGNDTATWVNGERDSEIGGQLWIEYCNQ